MFANFIKAAKRQADRPGCWSLGFVSESLFLERGHHGTGIPAHVEPPAASKPDQARPCLVQRRIFPTMKALQLDASNNISDQSRGTSNHWTGRTILSSGDLRFSIALSSLLLESYGSLPLDIRQHLVQNLVMLRNRGVITSIV